MAKVHLRQVTRENFRECLNLQVTESQNSLIATNTQSLAETYVDPHGIFLMLYLIQPKLT